MLLNWEDDQITAAWAQAKAWSTTQLETTIFAEYYPVPKLITPK